MRDHSIAVLQFLQWFAATTHAAMPAEPGHHATVSPSSPEHAGTHFFQQPQSYGNRKKNDLPDPAFFLPESPNLCFAHHVTMGDATTDREDPDDPDDPDDRANFQQV
jgi:hypothetical protein